MLGFLRGKVLTKSPETSTCILEAHDVGYELTITKQLYESLTEGDLASVWVHTHVREDLLVLYGFASEVEKQFFRVLLSVSGLGPKTALSLLAEHGAQKLTRLILEKETDEIAEASGVGKKLAQRIVLDLATKIEKLAWANQLQKLAPAGGRRAPEVSPERQLRDDLFSALENLGYPSHQIKGVLERLLEREEEMGFEGFLKAALKEMSGRPVVTNG